MKKLYVFFLMVTGMVISHSFDVKADTKKKVICPEGGPPNMKDEEGAPYCGGDCPKKGDVCVYNKPGKSAYCSCGKPAPSKPIKNSK